MTDKNWEKELEEINEREYQKGFTRGQERKKAGLPFQEFPASFGAKSYRQGFEDGQK